MFKKIVRHFSGMKGKFTIFGIFVLVNFILISAVSFKAIKDLNKEIDDANNVNLKLVEYEGKLVGTTHALGRWIWITYGIGYTRPDLQNKFIKKTEEELANFFIYKKSFSGINTDVEIDKILEVVDSKWEIVNDGINEANAKFAKHTKDSDEEGKLILTSKVLPNLVPISETLATIENILDKDVKLKRERATKNSNLVVKEMIIIGITSIIVLLLFMFWFSRKMNSTFKDFGEQMSRTISKVINASNELASASQELSQGTHEQAAFIQETAASIDELIAMVNKNTESAKHSAESSAEGQADAKIGMKVVDEMVSTFDILDQGNQKVFEKINESNLQLTLIVNLINEIGNKTKMINEIVFQTKLLSFNASVEAQRAGEHGKGFAIVAQEVGNLAESSRKASLEITHLLTDSTKKVNDIINQMKNNFETASIENKRQLESGLSTVSDCKVALNKIVDNVTVTKTLAEEISHASVEQQKGVSEISKSINHFDQINHQNAISADSLASVANLLLVESKGLNELVVDLEKVLNG